MVDEDMRLKVRNSIINFENNWNKRKRKFL